MTTTPKLLTGAAALAALIGIGFIPMWHDPDAIAAAHANTERVYAELTAENDAVIHREYTRLIYTRDGDASGALYERCTNFPPPAQPANQAKCKALLARLAREDAKTAAAEAKEKANW